MFALAAGTLPARAGALRAAVFLDVLTAGPHSVCGRLRGVALKIGGQTPLGPSGQPAELASIYVQLAAADASYANGQVCGATVAAASLEVAAIQTDIKTLCRCCTVHAVRVFPERRRLSS